MDSAGESGERALRSLERETMSTLRVLPLGSLPKLPVPQRSMPATMWTTRELKL